ncbi:MAG: DNA polymerase III subunit chi [Gammaproteobacteria bacterium]
MTRIDFYVLPENGSGGPEQLTCRLAEKAYSRGHRIFIHARDRDQAQQLDDLLWTYRQESFLPHALCGDELADESPIQIGHDTEPSGHCDVLINLSGEVPGFFSRFERVAELVGSDPGARERSREAFRFYKDRGYPLHTHHL